MTRWILGGVLLVAAAVLPAARPVFLVALMVLPGFALERLIRGRRSSSPDWLAVLLLAVGGAYTVSLVLNALAAATGAHLDRAWVLIGAVVLAVGAVAAALARGRCRDLASPPPLRARHAVLVCLLAVLPVLAAAGAEQINRGGWGVLSCVVMVVVLMIMVASVWFPRRGLLEVQVYAAAVTAILLGSLRGDFLSGIDMSREHYMYHLTDTAGFWTPGLSDDHFNSSLSITVFVRHLAMYFDLDGGLTFRVVLPLIYALIPVVICVLLKRSFDARVGALGAFVFMSQPLFVSWSTVPGRQMVAMVVFTALLYFLLPGDEALGGRTVLVIAFGVLTILSHYSTTYLSLLVLVLGSVILRVQGARAGRGFRAEAALSWPAVGILLAVAVLWFGPITHVGGNLGNTLGMSLRLLTSGDFSILGDSGYAPRTSLAHQLGIGEPGPDRAEIFTNYQDLVGNKVAEGGYQPLDPRSTSAPVSVLPLPPVPGAGTLPYAVAVVTDTVVRNLLRLFLAVGLVVAIVRIVRRREERPPWAAYGAAAGTALALVVIVPQVSIEYDVGRTTQHMLPLLAYPIIEGARQCGRLLGLLRLPNPGDLVLTFVCVALALAASGFANKVFHATAPQMMLDNEGESYEQIYVHDGEVAAARWLAGHAEPGVQVASGYFGSTRLTTGGLPRPYRRDVFPWSVGVDDYLYRGTHEIRSGNAAAYYGGGYLQYPYPETEIESQKSTIYVNDYARIYR